MHENKVRLTEGVSCPRKLSSGTPLSCLASERRSADGDVSVSKDCESLDSVRKLMLSARGVEGVLVDLIPLDLSLALVNGPKLLSRF